MKLVDTHCHLNFEAYEEDLDQVLNRAWEVGLERVLIPALDLRSSKEVVELAERDPRLFAAVGVHPNRAETWSAETVNALNELARHPKVKAIGEIGLDYFHDRAPREVQNKVFSRQCALARECNLPVVLHVRNAAEGERSCIIDLLEELKKWPQDTEEETPAKGGRGVVHSFSGNVEEARQVIALGYLVGITGPVTFEKAKTMQDVAAFSPSTSILIETDGPFLTPHPHRGKRNEPAYVKYIAEKIAQLRACSAREVGEVSTENADCLFQWR
ncbi:MAG: TatD family hydrolase [Anaerolineales bacterium]